MLMLHHLFNLLFDALVDFPTVLSGNWLSLLLPALLFAIFEGNKLRAGWSSMRTAFWRDTRILVAIYSVLFAWAVVKTIYADHVYFVDKTQHLKQDVANLPDINKPQLKFQIVNLVDGNIVTSGQTQLWLLIQTSNRGAPSSVRIAGAGILGPDGRHLPYMIVPRPTRDIELPRVDRFGGNILLRQRDEIFNKITETPIPRGSSLICWISLRTSVNQKILHTRGYSVYLDLLDIDDKAYHLEKATKAFPLMTKDGFEQ